MPAAVMIVVQPGKQRPVEGASVGATFFAADGRRRRVGRGLAVGLRLLRLGLLGLRVGELAGGSVKTHGTLKEIPFTTCVHRAVLLLLLPPAGHATSTYALRALL